MKTKLKRFHARMVCAVTLGIGSSFSLAAQAENSADIMSAKASQTTAWSEIGAKAGADYQGDGLAVIPTSDGVRLRCVFQRLDGKATQEGLWLSSTADGNPGDKFRVVAAAVGRQADVAQPSRLRVNGASSPRSASDNETSLELAGEDTCTTLEVALPRTGTVAFNGKSVRFARPSLVEEYTVSMDGVRQDFVVLERPEGAGELAVRLAVSGANVEAMASGARLVLENSGRKITYNRLRVTDAMGKELTARMEVASGILPDVEGAHPAARNLAADFSTTLLQDTPESAGLEAPALRQAGMPAATMLTVHVKDADAVYPVRIDPTFSDANWISMGGILGADRTVFAAMVDDSGNLYIGGSFTVVGDVIANRIAKWNGSSWTALGQGMDNDVSALVVSGSDVYVGGSFTNAGGSAANYIAKWNGTSWSALGEGMNGSVHALAVSGSEVYAGGSFTNAGGSAANYIGKWNGSSWTALGSGMGGAYVNRTAVYALAVSGSDVYAGGEFWTAGGNVAYFIAKWDGSSWSALGSGMNSPPGTYPNVRALAVSGSDVYAGGYFTTAGGSAANYIAKWNGSNWTTLGTGMGPDPIVGGVSFPRVFALAVSGSDVYAGGYFYTAGGSAANNIAKWNGSSWTALGSGRDSGVLALAVSGSDVYVAGGGTSGSAAYSIAKWNGSNWTALGSDSGVNNGVSALAASGSDVYAAGYFTTAGGSAANYTAKWDGISWTALGSGLEPGENPHSNSRFMHALAASGSDVYAAGGFTTAGGSPANYIAKWNGSSWTALGTGMNNPVSALAVSGSDLYAGGRFTTAGGIAVNYIAKWNGSSWTALGEGMDSVVYALAVSGSDVYAGGGFWTAGGSAANNIAKWDGNNWTPLGSGMGGVPPYVYALAVSGSNLYAGGAFTTAGGSVANKIAKWDGSSWSPLGLGMDSDVNSAVYALAVSGTDLYAAGSFTTAGGSAGNKIAKWDGSSWTPLGSGMARNGSIPYLIPDVSALVVSGSDLYAGGVFTTAGGKVSAYIVRAYLLTLPALSMLRSDTDVMVSWPSADTADFALEQAGTLAAPASWVTNGAIVTDDGANKSVAIPATNSPQFFRLRRP